MAEPSTGILGIIKFACAILGIGLFMWTPRTGKGFLFYGAGLAVLILLCFHFTKRRK
jgi:hypothetical protein